MAIRSLRPTVLQRELGPMRLWVDDLAEIVDLIADVDPILYIRTDAYQVEKVDELTGVKEKTIRSFEVTTRGGFVRLILTRHRSVITVTKPDLKARGMVTEIEKIAKRTKRGFLPFRSARQIRTYLFVLIVALGAIVFFGLASGVQKIPPSGADWTALLGGALSSPLFVYFILPRRGAVMYARTRAEMPTWWTRNRDGITTNVIVSAIFLVIGIVVGYLLPGKS